MPPSKRAAAPTKDDRPSKKAKSSGLDSQRPKNEPKLKRSVPITATVVPENDDDASDEEAWEEEENLAGGDHMEVDPPSENIQKEKNRAEDRRTQKALTKERRSHKGNYDLLSEAKKKWQVLLKKTKEKDGRENKKALVTDLMTLVQGHIHSLCTKHDASRIVQSIVKYGDTVAREQVVKELNEAHAWPELIKGRYSKFLLLKLFRLLPAHRLEILRQILPPKREASTLMKLLLHAEASAVLADVYELYSNEAEKDWIVRGFWGKEVTLFSPDTQENKGRGLQPILDSMGPDVERRKRVLREVKGNIDSVFANENKSSPTHPIVHRAVLEYIKAISIAENVGDDSQQIALRDEILETLITSLPELVHTKDGSQSVRLLIAYGSAKTRKNILKTLKPHLDKMATNQEASLILFTLFDSVDDTKLLIKTLLPSITPFQNEDLAKNVIGRRAVLYPIVGRTKRHFLPAVIREIEATDAIVEKTSKKDNEVRRKELNEGWAGELIRWVEQKGETILSKIHESEGGDDSGANGSVLLISEICLEAIGDKTPLFVPLLQPLTRPPAADTFLPRFYKTLLQGGHFNHATKSIEQSTVWPRYEFATALFNTLGKERVVKMCVEDESSSVWIVVAALEALIAAEELDTKDLRTNVKSWFGEEERSSIEKEEAKGSKMLIQTLEKL
ncbi:armadillo-type protein [Flagelloscypha sp. PMI_526]|nr:armadillo-type protein [Flagelloscypha sp. PMI_526]